MREWESGIQGGATDQNTDVRSQKAVSAYFTSKQILPFGFAEVCSKAEDKNFQTIPSFCWMEEAYVYLLYFYSAFVLIVSVLTLFLLITTQVVFSTFY